MPCVIMCALQERHEVRICLIVACPTLLETLSALDTAEPNAVYIEPLNQVSIRFL